MNPEKARLRLQSFITSYFRYNFLFWMFRGRNANNRINRTQERALRITYRNFDSSPEELLTTDYFVTIHQMSMQLFMVEIYKKTYESSTVFMKSIFEENSNQCKVRSMNTLEFRTVKIKSCMLKIRLGIWGRKHETLCQITQKTPKH